MDHICRDGSELTFEGVQNEAEAQRLGASSQGPGMSGFFRGKRWCTYYKIAQQQTQTNQTIDTDRLVCYSVIIRHYSVISSGETVPKDLNNEFKQTFYIFLNQAGNNINKKT